jgi:hypothetical protein
MPTYFGKVCARHPELGGERSEASRKCTACAREQNAAWAKANPEKVKAKDAAWAAANQEKRLESSRKYAATHREVLRERVSAWRKANPDKVKAQNAVHPVAWAKANPEKVREKGRRNTRAWRGRNADEVKEKANSPEGRAYRSARRARSRDATPAWANDFFIKEAYALAKLREKVTGGKWHVDHVVPLRSRLVCGLHCEQNLAVIRREANISKGNRHWPDMP